MSYVREKYIRGYGPYCYEVKSLRQGETVKQKHIRYLGKGARLGTTDPKKLEKEANDLQFVAGRQKRYSKEALKEKKFSENDMKQAMKEGEPARAEDDRNELDRQTLDVRKMVEIRASEDFPGFANYRPGLVVSGLSARERAMFRAPADIYSMTDGIWVYVLSEDVQAVDRMAQEAVENASKFVPRVPREENVRISLSDTDDEMTGSYRA